ncbi:peptidase M48 [Prauserella marina]|uniref:Zn-dependent protease with chaperone function n=1 Tax=Prauserella marina TaxID=530584 RepID=A0A222VR21_9PSEU|nr:M48 family metallopeptidase [Prauserella marina]ASR36358.1 peptidase M48 [Prauserella marina]PWV77150.1 Zn-dependent protease with chaperone function [Prauserella marina]SDD05588.1 Zn-dependent protease with chaperone function [Prauserella marina]
MNFFERQAEVRKASAKLVWLFVLAVIGIVAVIDLAVWWAIGFPTLDVAIGPLAIVTVLTVVTIGLTSWIRTLMLRRGGGGKVAASLGGVAVPEDTADPGLRRYRNVVEEIAIASGMPVPELYLLPHEAGINAFAAGWAPGNAAIAVTQGALDRLNRDELQGVIAHEFSHVVNGDMRLNIRLIGVLAGIVGLAVVGRVLLSGSGSRNRKNNNAGPLIIVALAAMIAGYIGVVCGRLIKAAVSRQREYLADASAVQFTRQTDGIAGALKKIGGLQAGSTLRAGKAEDVSHMLFGEGRKFSSLFATHPPLAKRIRLLDPAFDPAELEQLSHRWAAAPPSGLHEDQARGLAPVSEQHPQAPRSLQPPGRQQPMVQAQPRAVVANVGDPGSGSFAHAGTILRDIPEDFLIRARRADTVVPLVFGLLISADNDTRVRQYHALAARHGQPVADAAWNEGSALTALDPALRLPLSEIAFPALRHRTSEELTAIGASITELVKADGNTSIFEYCLSTLLHRDLHEAIHNNPPWRARHTSLHRSHGVVATLFAVLARVGHREPGAAEAAFRTGLATTLPGVQLPYHPPPQGPFALGAAWPVLDGLPGHDKAKLIEGVVAVIGSDGAMTVEESELLRTVCAVLHCPLPPLVGSQTAAPRSG